MTDKTPAKDIAAAVLGSGKGRLISALMVAFLVLGIAAEALSLVNGYYTLQKTKAEASSAEVDAHARTGKSIPLGIDSNKPSNPGHGRWRDKI